MQLAGHRAEVFGYNAVANALAAAVGFGVSVAMVKSLTRTEQTLSIMFWMLVVQSAAGFFPALYVRVTGDIATGKITLVIYCRVYATACASTRMPEHQIGHDWPDDAR